MRRALVMSNGSYATFVTRPVSCVLLILVLITFLYPIIKAVRGKKKAGKSEK
ncbi:MAG: hypothetical protein PHE06_06820 [Lachnospiraceae bacterium]|nr:hypothetical protein [Lachnospiraceae bacterium]